MTLTVALLCRSQWSVPGNLPLTPTTTLLDAPAEPTVLLVPGGDTAVLLADQAAMAAIRRLAERAGTIASVYTGTIALGAAGLLEGRRTTSHWSVRHLLTGYGATPVDERVVADGNVMTVPEHPTAQAPNSPPSLATSSPPSNTICAPLRRG